MPDELSSGILLRFKLSSNRASEENNGTNVWPFPSSSSANGTGDPFWMLKLPPSSTSG
jgi:hypothetical protein